MESQYRLNLSEIQLCLRRVQDEFHLINAQLNHYREPLTDAVVANMMAGYAYVDGLLVDGTDLFAMGNSSKLLELNEVVLCGQDDDKRHQTREHVKATKRHFYDDQRGGIRDLMDWHALHKNDVVWKRAAGAYVRILSEPQLYIEGNHRAGALIMSHILAREGQPPFVLTTKNAKAYFNPSTLVKQTRKRTFAMLFKIAGVRRQFAQMLKEQADRRFLQPAGPIDATETERQQDRPAPSSPLSSNHAE